MQRILSIGAALCILTTGALHATAPKSAADAKGGDACKQGRAQYASGDVLKALKSLGNCVEKEPRNRDAWVSLANASLEAGRFQPSVEAFAKAEALKSGDEAFLTSYLSALDGAGMTEARIPVLRALAAKKHGASKSAEQLLTAVEAAGPDKYPEEYLSALQWIAETPGADRYQVEKLAEVYLQRGQMEKAEAEYRGLLVKNPESGETWAGLGAALAATDPQAASECYRKAAFYSNQSDHRITYTKEQQRLASAAPKADAKAALAADDSKDQALLAATAKPSQIPPPVVAPKPEVKPESKPIAAAPVKPEPVKEAPKPAPAPIAKVEPATPTIAAAKPKPFDVKAFQDSIYKAELAKRMAAIHPEKAASPSAATPAASAPVPAAAAPVAVTAAVSAPSLPTASASVSKAEADKAEKADKAAKAAKEKADREAAAKDKAEKERIAKEEKAKQEALAKENEKKAKADKEQQEKLAKEAEKKAKEDKQKLDELARKQAEAEKERLAKAEKARQDSVSRVAELKTKEEKAKQDSLARVAEQKAKENKAKQEAMAKADKARQDSIARVAELKSKEEKAKQEAMAKAEKEKQDSIARVADQKAKDEKAKQAMAKAETARQDSVARVAEQKAKDEKAKQEAIAKADKARVDSLARVAELKAKVEKARQDSVVHVAEMKMKAEKVKQDSIARVAEQKAREEKERIAKEEERRKAEEAKARKLKEEQDHREKIARERRDRYDHAVALYRDGRNDSALMLFKTVLADSPAADAWYFAGRANLAKGDFGKALDLFEKAPKDKPDLDGLKGKALMGQGKHKEALKALEAQYAKTQDDSLLEDLSALKRKTGDEAGAIVYLEKLAEKHPGSENIQEQLAAFYRAKGDKDKATEKYSRVFIVNPAHAEANYWLGMEAANSGDQTRAVPFLEKAVTLLPTRSDAWKALAKADASLGRKDAAWEANKKAFALLPNDLELAKGKVSLARESHPTELAKAYEDVLRIAPEDADAAMGLAKIRYEEGNWPAAEKNFRIACKDSKDAHAFALFGRALLELKKTEEASVDLQKAVDLGEKDPSLHLDLARIRMDKGDLDWAEALLKDLSKKSPSDPEPLYYLGQIALKRQQTAVAEEFFRKAHQLKPDDGKYAEALARLDRDKDGWKDAVAVLSPAEGKLTLSGRLLYGDCLARGGDQAKAQTVYAELYKKEASASLLARRMDLLVRMGKADQAVEMATSAPFLGATEVRFSLAKAQLALADAHVLKGDVDQAVDLMKQVLKTDDHKPEYHYYLGLGFFDQNRPKKALGEFVDALTYRVDYPEALYRKGLCLIKTEDVKEAENAFGELSQHADPAWKARGLYGLAMVFEAQNKPEAVEHHLERSIAAEPLPDAMAYLSRVVLKQGKAAEAQDLAHKALAIDPAHEGATVALAEALAGAKKQSEAMELARQGLRAKPLSCGLMVQSAKLSFAAGKLDSTLAAGTNAIRICPEEPMGYYYAGVATHGSNRPKEAKQYFKSFTKYGGDKKLVPVD